MHSLCGRDAQDYAAVSANRRDARILGNKPKGVVTSKEVRFTKIILDHFDIACYFDAIVGGDTTPARKPDPRPFLESDRLLGGRLPGRFMVGDSENDINAGRGAGTRTAPSRSDFAPPSSCA